MINYGWLVPVFALLVIAGSLHWAIYRRRESLFFGVRVAKEYHTTPEGKGTLRAFVRELWACTVISVVLTVLGIRLGNLALIFGSQLLLVAIASVAFYLGFRATLPHALPPEHVRSASLAAPEETGLPGGWIGTLGPFVLLGTTALYLRSHWSEIPQRFPIHWGFDGQPNSWSTRAAGGVFWPLLLAAAIQALMLGMALFTTRNSRRSRVMAASVKALVATAWFIAIIFSIVTLMPLMPGPPVSTILIAVFGFVGLVIWLTARAAAEPSDERATPDECWKWGQFYYNPNDSAIFVEKRFGLGYTLNFAHHASWIFLVAVIGLPLALVAFSLLK